MTPKFFNKYNCGQTDFVTPGKQLEYVANVKPDANAIEFVRRDGKVDVISFQQLEHLSNRLAWYLLESGIGPHSKVIVAFPNGIMNIAATLAIWKTGACHVPLSCKSPKDEFCQVYKLIRPNAVFSSCPGNWNTLEGVIHISEADIYKNISMYPSHMPPDVLANPNMINLSGGTSGKLKLSQQNNPSGMDDEILRNWFHMSGQCFDQRQLITGPLFHGAPHTCAFNALFAGSTVVITESLHPENVVKCIREQAIESVQMVPTLMYRIIKLDDLDSADFRTVKSMFHTGGYCSQFLKQAWMDILTPERIYEVYSMTEAIGITCIRGDEWLLHRGSVGRAFGGKVSIRDESFNELPPGKVGEIFMAFPNMGFNITYYNCSQLPLMPGGYRSVGDLGYLDADGYLYFADRRMDMIVTGGENVFACEVENALSINKDVVDAVVLGISDEEWGRKIVAVIEAKRPISSEELRSFLSKYLAPYKIPKEFVFVDRMPRNENGKINRIEMAQKYKDNSLIADK